LEEPSHGWFLAGFTTRLYLIDATAGENARLPCSPE
jgi:hypothetical protein